MKIETDAATIDMRHVVDDDQGFEVLFELPADTDVEGENRECILTITNNGSIRMSTYYGVENRLTDPKEYRIVANKRGEFRIKKCRK